MHNFLGNQEIFVEKLIPEQPIISQFTQRFTLQPQVIKTFATKSLQSQINHQTNLSPIVVTEQKSVFVSQPPQSVQSNIFIPRQHVVEPFHPLLTSLPKSTFSIIESTNTHQLNPMSTQLPVVNKIDMNVELKTKISKPDSFEKFIAPEILQKEHTLPNLKFKPSENSVESTTTTTAQPIEQKTKEQKIFTVQLKTTNNVQTTSINIF